MRVLRLFLREFLLLVFFIFLASHCLSWAEGQDSKRAVACSTTFIETGFCPDDLCRMDCLKDPQKEGCFLTCLPKSCFEIGAEHCPTERCQIVKGCGDRDVCYEKRGAAGPACGGSGYLGAEELCCDGLVKRCGIEFFDGSCDLLGENSVYSIPICVPCGNGICNQFENRCNCPEDCDKKFRERSGPVNKT
ncbi:MAG: hypothetical protein WC552_03085 [Candidatus Omnitrophota bacterium]